MFRNRINEELGYLIKEVQQDLRKKMDNSLININLTTPQYAVLSQLKEYPGLSNAELSRKSFVTPQTMNLIVQNLEDRHFVIRSHSKNHGKIMNTEITESGVAILEKANVLVFEVEEQIFGGLLKKESNNLRMILQKLRKKSP
jgi:DNA-binding MarR family transcriptional regulator